ncbi:hypothetical protein ACOSQ2_028864 [Xanthoceras sorbifolium]
MGLLLGGRVGKVVDMDSGLNGLCLGRFLRVRVLVEVSKPLKRGLRVLLDDPDDLCQVLLRYERLPNICYFYGRMGHLVRECPDNVDNIVDESQLRFGAWMKAGETIYDRVRVGRSGKEGSTDSKEETVFGKAGEEAGLNMGGIDIPISVPAEVSISRDLSGDLSVINQVVVREDSGEVSSPKVKKWKRVAHDKIKGICLEGKLTELASKSKNGGLCWKSRFHFEEAWVEEPDCREIVEAAWNNSYCRDAVSGVLNSSEAVADRLRI